MIRLLTGAFALGLVEAFGVSRVVMKEKIIILYCSYNSHGLALST